MARQPEEPVSSPRHKFHEVFQPKQGRYSELPPSRISEMLKSSSLDNAPTQSLLSVVNSILDESIDRKNGEIPDRVACLLRKVVLEIERRISTQAEHIRNQNNLFKAREDKYQSRIRVLETLATGASEESEIVLSQLQLMKSSTRHGKQVYSTPAMLPNHSWYRNTKEKTKTDERKKKEEQDMNYLTKEKDDNNGFLNTFENFDLDKSCEQHQVELENKVKEATKELMMKKEESDLLVARLQAELEVKNKLLEDHGSQLGEKFKEATGELIKAKETNDLMAAKLEEDVKSKNRLLEKLSLQLETKIKEATNELLKEKESADNMVAKLKGELDISKKELINLKKEKEDNDVSVAELKSEIAKKEDVDQSVAKLKSEIEKKDRLLEELNMKLELKMKEATTEAEKEKDNGEIVSKLKDELDMMKKSHDQHCLDLETKISHAREQLMKQIELNDHTVTKLKDDIETTNTLHETELKILKSKLEEADKQVEEQKMQIKKKIEVEFQLEQSMKKIELNDQTVTKLKDDIETRNTLHEAELNKLKSKLQEVEKQVEEQKMQIKKKIEVEFQLEQSKKMIKELESLSNARCESWQKKETIYNNFVSLQLQALQDLRSTSCSIKKEVIDSKRCWGDEFNVLGAKFRQLVSAAERYYSLLAENRKLYNEVQELKGNIRVYCRIRPFLSGQNGNSSTVDHVGDNGELIITNPLKQGKDGHKMFKFNKVFGPTASQEEVYLDTQPLIRSVLDGFNVCIFAYGQTGSGKTYTMSGPNSPTKETVGVNYRALNDLFDISQTRRNTFSYEVEVQMVEIYNEQVRDLLSTDSSQKRLEIRNISQPSGLAVPDATMYPVNSTSDVIDFMQVGHTNRAMSATALNERSSRSHSVVTVHVRGTDLKTGASFRGCLHLVDLAGSERVDRSEVTGDRLKEAQHINKSLSALGDVIYSLSQKSSHVPYRNSKLTQLLQSSLGGHAKTLMFVQVNPDADSYSETLSTLKFAERASGVELGAARSNKEGKDVKDLMEQIASLKETIARKDEEIERLDSSSSHLKTESLGHSQSSPSLHSLKGNNQQSGYDNYSDSDFSNATDITNTGDGTHSGSLQDVGNCTNKSDTVEVDNTKSKVSSQSSRQTSVKARVSALSQPKLVKESLKSPLSPRRANASQQPATTSVAARSPKRWA